MSVNLDQEHDVCAACGRPIILVNVDKMRGVVGLTMGWIHASRWRAFAAGAGWGHRAIPTEYLRPEAGGRP